jgi:hypothetical protein
VWLGGDTDLRCQETRTDEDGLGDLSNRDVEAYLVSGIIQCHSSGVITDSVSFHVNLDLELTAGERSYFRTPAFGTAYWPEDSRAEYVVRFGSLARSIPKELVTIIRYRELESNERLEIVTPELVESSRLLWADETESVIEGSGTLVDLEVESRNRNDLFVAGVLIGVSAAFVPLVLQQLWRSLMRCVKGRKGDR